MSELTLKGKTSMENVYNAIVDYTIENLYSPSIAEIKEMCNTKSNSATERYLKNLEHEGKIKLYKGNRRIQLIGYKLVPDIK